METTSIRKLKATWTFESEFELNSQLASSDVTDELFAGILAEFGESQAVFRGSKHLVNWKIEGF